MPKILAFSLAKKVAGEVLDRDCPNQTFQRTVEWFEAELRGMYGSQDIPAEQEQEAAETLQNLWEEANDHF